MRNTYIHLFDEPNPLIQYFPRTRWSMATRSSSPTPLIDSSNRKGYFSQLTSQFDLYLLISPFTRTARAHPTNFALLVPSVAGRGRRFYPPRDDDPGSRSSSSGNCGFEDRATGQYAVSIRVRSYVLPTTIRITYDVRVYIFDYRKDRRKDYLYDVNAREYTGRTRSLSRPLSPPFSLSPPSTSFFRFFFDFIPFAEYQP